MAEILIPKFSHQATCPRVARRLSFPAFGVPRLGNCARLVYSPAVPVRNDRRNPNRGVEVYIVQQLSLKIQRHLPKALIITLLLLCGYSAAHAEDDHYSRSIKLPSIRISFSKLQDIIDKASSLMTKANSSVPLFAEQIVLSKDSKEITISGHEFNSKGKTLPKIVDQLSLRISTREAAPISTISMNFGDYQRSFSVDGQSFDEVDAVFSVISEELLSESSCFGGSFLKGNVFLFTVIVFPLLLISFSSFCYDKIKRVYIQPIFAVSVLFVLYFALPVNDIFAGFSAIQGDASFAVRYGPEIGLAGLLISILGSFSLSSLFPGRYLCIARSEGSKSD